MARLNLSAAIVAVLCLYSGTVAAETQVLPGDIVTGLLPVAAFSVAFFKDDSEGEKQWLRNTAVTAAVNTGLRLAFNETGLGRRPNGEPYGFPSGHAGFVFSQAAFLQERYGWKFGVPAYAFAGYVAYVRVASRNHYARDVIASAALSYAMAKLFVTPEHATHLAPVVGPDFLGLRWERSF